MNLQKFFATAALGLEPLLAAENWKEFVVPPEIALAHFEAVYLDEVNTDHVIHGRVVADPAAVGDALACAYGVDGAFIAILKGSGGFWKPHKVFLPQT